MLISLYWTLNEGLCISTKYTIYGMVEAVIKGLEEMSILIDVNTETRKKKKGRRIEKVGNYIHNFSDE